MHPSSSTFLLFLERAQPFPLLESNNLIKEGITINPLSNSSKGKAALDNKLLSLSDRQLPGSVKDEQVQWKQDILVKLDSLSKEQEVRLCSMYLHIKTILIFDHYCYFIFRYQMIISYYLSVILRNK